VSGAKARLFIVTSTAPALLGAAPPLAGVLLAEAEVLGDVLLAVAGLELLLLLLELDPHAASTSRSAGTARRGRSFMFFSLSRLHCHVWSFEMALD
jgi:hypothetical protein